MSDLIEIGSLTTRTQLRSTSHSPPQTIVKTIETRHNRCAVHTALAVAIPSTQIGLTFENGSIARSDLFSTYFNKSFKDTSTVIENIYHLLPIKFCKNSSIERIELWHQSEPIPQL
ncbi:hypothetical protein [Chamaesiphon sp.]|uniref:hypothetical protein n=1 Tax=Chamaesiphon sp. TaxID=2814140 RepID=UPI00359444D8